MSDFEIIDRHGKRRRGRKGEILRDGERAVVGMTFMDQQFHDALVEEHRDAVVRVVDAAGQPAGHRPGFLMLDGNALGDSAAEAAYSERLARLDATMRKRRRPDDDGEGDGRGTDLPRGTEMERRQALARKAARATLGSDARPLTLDEARAAADAAREARDERLRNGWRTR
jgi:hypothetical protein